jgi:hypothetical protein
MRLLSWLTNRFSQRHKAMALYQRGMIRAKLRDHQSALADFTAVVDMEDVPADIRAMALYNRAVVYTASHHDLQAIRDLELLLEMRGAAANVRTAAKRQLVRIQRSSDRLEQRQANGEP